ncbi:MAG: ABC transporter ATP-binding protein [Burkholderiales bacterium]|nr:ABC transporter ATP-binding protein [Burkholderiales bacterium]
MSSSVIELRGVGKRFGEVCAVEDASLAIARGEIFGLIGHNGAGKTTLFRLMLGLAPPTAGTIEIQGKRVDGAAFREVRRQIGYLPENVVLWDNLTGLETLRFFAGLKGADRAQCDELLDRVGLRAAAQRKVHGYSKGMRQRLGLAQALLGRPALLFLDEPTAGLDPQSRREFYVLLAELRGRGVTMMLTSHVLAEMQERVDRLAIMRNGRIAAVGTLAGLRDGIDLRLRADIRVRPGAAPTVQSALAAAGFPPAEPQDGAVRIVCLRREKMALLGALAPLMADLEDVQLREPSLEDIFLGHAASEPPRVQP